MQSSAWTLLCSVVVVTLNSCGVLLAPHHHQGHHQPHNTSHVQRHVHLQPHHTGRANFLNKSATQGKRRNYRKKKTFWKTMTNTLTQVVLGDDNDDDDYDSSSSSRSGSSSKSDSASLHSTERPRRVQWDSQDIESSDNKLEKVIQTTTPSPLRENEVNSEQPVNSLQTAAEPERKLSINDRSRWQSKSERVVSLQRILPKETLYKTATRNDYYALLERAVTYLEQTLSFIECAAVMEVVALAVIAASVYRAAALPMAVPVLSKV